MTEREKEGLLAEARRARKHAYAPYSHFTVGAALLFADGEIVLGCNLENAAYSPTLCAERAALGAAQVRGKARPVALAVVGGFGEEESDCAPCGVCRQMLAEMAGGELAVLFRDGGRWIEAPLGTLLPYTFQLK